MKKPKTHIGLSDKAREKAGKILNHTLADAFRLLAATRDYHWNVTGLQFVSLHKLFDEQYNAMDKHLDAIAERGRAIGVAARGSWEELTKMARCRAKPGDALTGLEMVGELLSLHEGFCQRLREDIATCTEEIGDAGTADFLTKILEYHETTAWMLRSLLNDRVTLRS